MEEVGSSRLAEGEREAALSHLLQLERERRIKAEQMVEAEKQACLEFHRLLVRERRIHTPYPTSPSQITLVPGTGEGEGHEVPGPGREAAFVYPQVMSVPATAGRGGWELPVDISGPQDSSLLSLGSDFSMSVFSQLPSDLQQMLGVTTADASQAKPLLMRAMEAVKADDPDRLQRYLNRPDAGSISTADGQHLLDTACETGHTGCARVLLNAGYSPNSSCRGDGMIPVHLAARNGHTASLKLLLEGGGNPSYQDHEDQSPLFLALCEGKTETIGLLLDFGSSMQTVTKSGYTPLHAAVSGNLPEALRSLLVHLRTSLQKPEVKRVVNYQDRDGSTALHLAASRGFQRCVEVLCGCAEVDLSLRDRWNRLALDISTDDCKDLLVNKESKEVVVCVEEAGTPVVAIGQITILRHHKFPDLEPLVEDALQQYCNNLRSHTHHPTPSQKPFNRDTVSANRDSTSASLSARLKKDLVTGSTSSNLDNHLPDILREAQHKLARMDLSAASIAGYRIDQMQWAPGEISQSMKSKNLFSVFGGTRTSSIKLGSKGSRRLEVFITLKGLNEGALDHLAFELMMPVAKLKEYLQTLEKQGSLMVHGPHGSGKTFLAKTVADTFKHSLDGDRTQVLHVSLHPGFKRDDLFRLLHINEILAPAVEEVDSDVEGEGSRGRVLTPSSLQPRYHIMILDDTDKVCAVTVLAELLTALQHRGPTNPLWINDVHGRDGTLLYPAGQYYLKTHCYLIATRTTGSAASLPASVSDHFVHVRLGPSTGVLYRHLMARLINTREGRLPHCSDDVLRAVQWVWQTWVLYNHYMVHLNLPELTTGVRHFLQCPLEANSPDQIHSWLCHVWNHHLTPWIEESLLADGGRGREHGQDTVNYLLMATIQKAFKPTCPLDFEGTVELLKKFRGSVESGDGGQRKKNMAQRSPPLRTVSSLTHIPVDRTPPLSSATQPPPMVAYKDMAKNSPRSKSKPPPGPAPRRAGTLKSLGSWDMADSASVDSMPLGNGPRRGKSLRKLRTKAMNLFARGSEKEGGGTLPRLFRKGSRTSLASVVEQSDRHVPTHQQSSHLPTKPSDDLTNFFDMVAALSSTRYDDQRSPAPSLTTSPCRSPEHAVDVPVQTSTPDKPVSESCKTTAYRTANASSSHAKKRSKSADDVLSNGSTVDSTDEMIDDIFQRVSEDDILSPSPTGRREGAWVGNGCGSQEYEREEEEDRTLTSSQTPTVHTARKGVANGHGYTGYEPEASFERRDSDTSSLLFNAGIGFISPDSPILKGVTASPSLSKQGSSSLLAGHSLTLIDRIDSEDDIAAEM